MTDRERLAHLADRLARLAVRKGMLVQWAQFRLWAWRLRRG